MLRTVLAAVIAGPSVSGSGVRPPASRPSRVVLPGSGGAAFYLIESGTANVTVAGRERAALGPGDYFGEIALIDEGARSATITAVEELGCYGLTFWDFRPLVQENAAICWKLLQVMVGRLRTAEAAG